MNCLLLVETLSARRLAQSPIKAKDALRIYPDSFAFTSLVGLMASLPTFGIDAPPPKPFGDGRRSRNDLGRTGFGDERLSHELESAPSRLWDDIGSRRPQPDRSVWLCTCWHRKLGLHVVHFAVDGAGASATTIAAFAIVRDIFDGEAGGAKMANVILAIYIVPMIAPTVGATRLALSSWRAINLVPIAGGLMLLMAMSGMSESAKIDPNARLGPTPIIRNYLRGQRHPVCVGNILCNAAAIGSTFAYFTGSSLFFIDALCLKPYEYGVIFGACSLPVMAGARGSRKLSGWGLSPAQVISVELALSTILATSLLLMGGKSAVVVVLVIVGVALSFGLISPYATKEALRRIPEVVGSISAARTFVQMIGAASSSAIDGHSVFSMAVVMFAFCLFRVRLAWASLLPAEG